MYINFYKQRKRFIILVLNDSLRKKCPNTYFSGPYFPAFGLNTEICKVNLRIQSKYGKIRTRKTPYFDTFYAVNFLLVQTIFVKSVIINH